MKKFKVLVRFEKTIDAENEADAVKAFFEAEAHITGSDRNTWPEEHIDVTEIHELGFPIRYAI